MAPVTPLPSIKAERLGNLAAILLPLEKLKQQSTRGTAFEQEIHDFLFTNFNGYTVSSGNISGHWSDDQGHDHYGEHRQYKVAAPNTDAVKSLEVFLAGLAHEMDEECIYLELGGEIYLIYAQKIS